MKENYALTILGPGNIALQKQPVPAPKDDEVLIKVHYVAVCGSDVKLFAGTYTAPHKYPVVMGHEWLGTVIESGKDAKIPPGQLVTGDCSVYCGGCYYCGVNKNHCETIEKRGITIDGGAADYIVVKARHVNCCPQIETPMLLTLTEPMSVAVNGILNRVPAEALSRTRRALIFGCGGIGLMSLFTLLDANIPEIVMADLQEDKVKRVQEFQIPQVSAVCTSGQRKDSQPGLPPSADSTGGQHKDSQPGLPTSAGSTSGQQAADAIPGTFDLIIEATGSRECLVQTVSLANPCAHIVCLGHQSSTEFDFGAVVKKSLTIHASNGSTGGFPKAMELIQKYQEYVRQMVTMVVPFSEAADFFQNRLAKTQYIKIIFDLSQGKE